MDPPKLEIPQINEPENAVQSRTAGRFQKVARRVQTMRRVIMSGVFATTELDLNTGLPKGELKSDDREFSEEIREQILTVAETGVEKLPNQLAAHTTLAGSTIRTGDRDVSPGRPPLSRESVFYDFKNEQDESIFTSIDDADFTLLQECLNDERRHNRPLQTIHHSAVSLNPLQYAINNKQYEMAKILLQAGGETLLHASRLVNSTDNVETVWHQSVKDGQLSFCEEIVDCLKNPTGVSANANKYLHSEIPVQMNNKDSVSMNVLHLAAYYGHKDIVEYLVKKINFEVDERTNINGFTAVILAAMKDYGPVARRLLELGADPHQHDDQGFTLLHYVCISDNLWLLNVLLEYNIDVEKAFITSPTHPLMLCAENASINAADNLMERSPTVQQYLCKTDTSNSSRNNPLHIASSYDTEAHTKLVQLFLRFQNVPLNIPNEHGDTPLLLAARADNSGSVISLLTHGCDLKTQNSERKTVWHYVISRDTNKSLLAVLEFYRFKWSLEKYRTGETFTQYTMCRSRDNNISPLHIAAALGKPDKIKVLLHYKISPLATDDNGNTFLHAAAIDNQIEILKLFSTHQTVNAQNNYGDTVTMTACKSGNEEAVLTVLPHTDGMKINKDDRTILHESLRLPSTVTNLTYISQIITHLYNSSVDLLHKADIEGRTALHIAASRHNSDDLTAIFQQLSRIDPNLKNLLGQTALHEALIASQESNFFDLLRIYEDDIDVNVTTAEGLSLLHVAINHGTKTVIENLISSGADLVSRVSETGDTVLHHLITTAYQEPNKLQTLQQILIIILQCADRWLSNRNHTDIPNKETEEYEHFYKSAIIKLLTATYNRAGHSVIQHACRLGQPEILEVLLNVDKVFIVHEGKTPTKIRGKMTVLVDVTGFAPNTKPQSETQENRVTLRDQHPADIEMDRATALAAAVHQAKPTKRISPGTQNNTLLETIIFHSPDDKIIPLLDCTPIKEMVEDYWEPYKYIFGIMLVLHIIGVSLYSEYSYLVYVEAIPCLYELKLNKTLELLDNKTIEACRPEILPDIFILTWPVIILLLDLISIYSFLRQALRHNKSGKSVKRSFTNAFFHPIKYIQNRVYWWIGFLYSIFSIAWFVLYMNNYFDQDYILSISYILGWVYTIYFTQGFPKIHHFSLIIQRMILRDFTRFFFVFVFILVGFTCAFHVLLQAIPTYTDEYPKRFDTGFALFNWLAGLGSYYDDSNKTFEERLKSSDFNQVMYMVCVTITMYVLMNLLVAIMTDSYASIQERHAQLWRKNSLQFALHLERNIPVFARIFHLFRNLDIRYDDKYDRFYLKLERDINPNSAKAWDDDSGQKSIVRKLDDLQAAVATLGDSLENMHNRTAALEAIQSKKRLTLNELNLRGTNRYSRRRISSINL